jgi:ABC-type dipeptide/oligopeptide/nickel transport system permease component
VPGGVAHYLSAGFLDLEVFGLPGALRMTLQASASGDFALLQGLVIVSAALVVLGTFVVDAIGGWLDPRVYDSRRPR